MKEEESSENQEVREIFCVEVKNGVTLTFINKQKGLAIDLGGTKKSRGIQSVDCAYGT